LKPTLATPDPKIIAPGYLVRQGGVVRGPINLEGLMSLVDIGRLSNTAEFATENTAEFKPAREWDFYFTLFPQEKQRQGGESTPPTEVKPVIVKNSPENWPAPDPKKKREKISRKFYRLTEAKFHRINQADGAHPRHDVPGILRVIRQAEIDAGLDHVRQNRFRISKRTRDFWFLFISVNALFLFGAIQFRNFISSVYALSGMVLFTISLVWIMFGVMDRY